MAYYAETLISGSCGKGDSVSGTRSNLVANFDEREPLPVRFANAIFNRRF